MSRGHEIYDFDNFFILIYIYPYVIRRPLHELKRIGKWKVSYNRYPTIPPMQSTQ